MKISISSAKNVSSVQVTSTCPTSFTWSFPSRSIVHCLEVDVWQPPSSCAAAREPPHTARQTRRQRSQGYNASQEQARARARGMKSRCRPPQNITRTGPANPIGGSVDAVTSGPSSASTCRPDTAIRPPTMRGARAQPPSSARATSGTTCSIVDARASGPRAARSSAPAPADPGRRRHDERPGTPARAAEHAGEILVAHGAEHERQAGSATRICM